MKAFRYLSVLLVLFLVACGSQVDSFVPLPPPVAEEYPVNQLVQTIGETEQVSLQSPFVSVEFGQTGSFAGGIKLEEICLKNEDVCATMLATKWGDWLEAEIDRAEAYDSQGRLIGGWIEEKVDEASILQWLGGCMECTIERSRLIFEYVSPEPGATPRLERIYYFEEWGLSSKYPAAFGTAHTWDDPAGLFPDHNLWGYWESTRTPFQTVVGSLERAEDVLRQRTPALQVVDHDSVGREFLGRQTGFDIIRDGEQTGRVDLTYRNTWGQMPNTEIIGKGALSRVEWIEGDSYYAMSVLSPALSPEPTSLYLFCESRECADYVEINQQDWPLLYEQIRQGQIEDLSFAVYAIGHIGSIDRMTDEGSVHVGEGGGVHYSILGNPSWEEVDEAYDHLSLLGLNGVKAMGLYYATWPGSGTGLEYYLAIIRLATASEDRVLKEYGLDVGTLDRVGFMPLD
jgi:hypothetical protein